MSNQTLYRRTSSWPFAALAIAASVSLGACADQKENWPTDYTANISSALRVIPTCDALENARVEVVVNQLIANHQYNYYWDVDGPELGGEAPPTDDGQADGPGDFTGTNLQEQGVDEADIVKTDGDWMYVVDGSKLHVFDSWPPEDTSLAKTLRIRGANAELFLVDERLVVMSHLYSSGRYDGCYEWGCDAIPEPAEPGEEPGSEALPHMSDMRSTLLEIYDIADPSDPQPVRSLELEGDRLTARVVDGQIYLVHSMYTYDHGINVWQLGQDLKLEARLPKDQKVRAAALNALRPELRREVHARIQGQPQTVLPRYRANADEDPMPIFGCNHFYVPESSPDQWTSLSILSLDILNDESTPNGVGVLANGGHVYASSETIYIARDSRFWLWIDNQMEVIHTDIHAFALQDGSPDYIASGRVEGYTRDRFTMSERDGVFRIATTDQQNWFWGGDVAIGAPVMPDTVEPEPTEPSSTTANFPAEAPPVQANNLFTLKRQGTELVKLGEVRGFGETEQIYGTRYVGDMAYVVTFRRTDPLYSIDLSDPANPTIRGELKIPGFSNFLQSIGDGWLVGIGQDADENGFVTGFQVQLFDVRDHDQPLRTSQLLIDTSGFNSSHSEAEHESRAFTWYPSRNLLSIPISTYDETGYFSGLLVMRITPEEGIVEVGRVDHSAIANPHCGENCIDTDEYYYWVPQMRRSAFIDDYLFAISQQGFSVSAIDELDQFLFSMPLGQN